MSSYLDLLKAGGSLPPEELGAIVGVDLSDPGFWSSGLELIERQLDAAEAAAREAGRIEWLVIAERIPLPGGEVELMRPPDAEALISEESFEHEEFLPYWAELWASAVALAHDVSIRSLRGRRTLELGCGLGLPSIAAARAGGRVLATDWSPDAVRATAANAERNDVDIETLRCAWGEPDAIVARAPWQLVIASDVLYERRNVDQLLELLPRLVDERGLVLLADPGRVPSEGFLARAPEEGWIVRSTAQPAGQASLDSPPAARLDELDRVAAASADGVGGLERGLEQCGGAALPSGRAGCAHARDQREATRPERATGHLADALGDADDGRLLVNAGADGGQALVIELADQVERPQDRGDVPAELAQHEARGRAAAVLHEALHAVEADHDHRRGARSGRMKRPCQAVEQRRSGWEGRWRDRSPRWSAARRRPRRGGG